MATNVADIIRAFEPILYFPKGERFFPSDCKRYLERAALWNAIAPFDLRENWRRNAPSTYPRPILEHGQVSGRPDEPGTYLGTMEAGAFPFLYASGADEGFLELTGWSDGPSVAPSNENRFANLDRLEQLYSSDGPDGDPFLKDSRFWYHAEVFDAARLRALMAGNNAPAHLRELFTALLTLQSPGEPLLLCYYLFFPGHDEGLEDCADVANSDKFGSYAGEWACVSILLKDIATEVPVDGAATPKWAPLVIGLTSRNIGDIAFLGGEQRIGMRIFDFDAQVQTVRRDRGPGKQEGIHARLFVAKGTHGLYLRESFLGEELQPFTPEDRARQFCGANELLGKSLEDLADAAKDKNRPWVAEPEVFWMKGLFNFIWALIEWIAGGGGGMWAPGTGTPPQYDRPAVRDVPAYFSVIIHPAGVDPPQGALAQRVAWPSPLADEARLEMKADGRRYSMLVDRVSPDNLLRQAWWPGIQGFVGYSGRWGPRTFGDPKARRAGMKFPEFWDMFMTAFAKFKAK